MRKVFSHALSFKQILIWIFHLRNQVLQFPELHESMECRLWKTKIRSEYILIFRTFSGGVTFPLASWNWGFKCLWGSLFKRQGSGCRFGAIFIPPWKFSISFTQKSANKDGTTNYFLSGLFTVSYPEAAELNFLGDSETCQGLRVVSTPTWRFSLQDGRSGGKTNR